MQISNTRLIVLICALAALSEVIFFSALAPLLPSLDRQLGLGHVAAGLLVASYGIGYMLGAYPGLRSSTSSPSCLLGVPWWGLARCWSTREH
jgi:predicted MFS family arabinose efflux permease